MWTEMSCGSESNDIEKGDRIILYADGLVEGAIASGKSIKSKHQRITVFVASILHLPGIIV